VWQQPCPQLPWVVSSVGSHTQRATALFEARCSVLSISAHSTGRNRSSVSVNTPTFRHSRGPQKFSAPTNTSYHREPGRASCTPWFRQSRAGVCRLRDLQLHHPSLGPRDQPGWRIDRAPGLRGPTVARVTVCSKPIHNFRSPSRRFPTRPSSRKPADTSRGDVRFWSARVG
jgi:hypothetical protein